MEDEKTNVKKDVSSGIHASNILNIAYLLLKQIAFDSFRRSNFWIDFKYEEQKMRVCQFVIPLIQDSRKTNLIKV